MPIHHTKDDTAVQTGNLGENRFVVLRVWAVVVLSTLCKKNVSS